MGLVAVRLLRRLGILSEGFNGALQLFFEDKFWTFCALAKRLKIIVLWYAFVIKQDLYGLFKCTTVEVTGHITKVV